MQIYVPYFGGDHSSLFSLWVQQLVASGCSCSVHFIFPDSLPPPESRGNRLKNAEFISVPMHKLKKRVRLNTAGTEKMDIKEMLALYSLRLLAAPAFVMDLDALIQHDPFKSFEGKGDFGMVRDPMIRWAKNAPEHNAGVMYFSGNRKEEIATHFEKAWDELQITVPTNSVLLGQKAWSLAHHRVKGFMMEDTMNWSRCWGPNSDAKIYHYHGRSGKFMLSEKYGLQCP